MTGNGTRVKRERFVQFAWLSPTLKEGFDQTAPTRHVWICPYLTPATFIGSGRFDFWRFRELFPKAADGRDERYRRFVTRQGEHLGQGEPGLPILLS